MAIPDGLGPFLGPLFFGILFNWLLLGAVLYQVYVYRSHFKRDSFTLKTLVYALSALNILQTCLSSEHTFGIFVRKWGDPTPFASASWSGCSFPFITSIISATVQIFFAWRIYRLRKHEHRSYVMISISVLITMLALLQSLSSIVHGVMLITSLPNPPKAVDFNAGIKIWLAASFGCDVLIAASVLHVLVTRRQSSHSHSPWKPSDALIKKMMITTVETGTLTAILTGTELILFLVFPATIIHQSLSFFIGKLYTSVLLANLNARIEHRCILQRPGDPSDTFNTYPSRGLRTGTTILFTREHLAQVQTQDQEEDRDEYDQYEGDEHEMSIVVQQRTRPPTRTSKNSLSFVVPGNDPGLAP